MTAPLERAIVAKTGHGLLRVTSSSWNPTNRMVGFSADTEHQPVVVPWESEPRLVASPTEPVFSTLEIGEKIFFVRQPGSTRNPVCAAWCLAEDWDEQEQLIRKLRPLRLVLLCEGRVEQVLWQGDPGEHPVIQLRRLCLQWPNLGDDVISQSYYLTTEGQLPCNGPVLQTYGPDLGNEGRPNTWMTVPDRRPNSTEALGELWGLHQRELCHQ